MKVHRDFVLYGMRFTATAPRLHEIFCSVAAALKFEFSKVVGAYDLILQLHIYTHTYARVEGPEGDIIASKSEPNRT